MNLNDTYSHNNTYSKELLEAAYFCGIPVGDIEDVYAGYAYSDEEFAKKVWESSGYLDETLESSKDHTDWSSVARDLMTHYVTYNGYYFNLNY